MLRMEEFLYIREQNISAKLEYSQLTVLGNASTLAFVQKISQQRFTSLSGPYLSTGSQNYFLAFLPIQKYFASKAGVLFFKAGCNKQSVLSYKTMQKFGEDSSCRFREKRKMTHFNSEK